MKLTEADSLVTKEYAEKITATLPPYDDNGPDEKVGMGDQKVDYYDVCMYSNI